MASDDGGGGEKMKWKSRGGGGGDTIDAGRNIFGPNNNLNRAKLKCQ